MTLSASKVGTSKIMYTPFISVIIPTYNRQNTIMYCLQSVLNQTYQHFEVVIADDASTDATVQTVKAIADSRIRVVIADKNRGAQAARNLGIRAAKGDWIAFLDSDDYWKLDKLEKQIQILKEHNFNKKVVVHSNCELQVNGTITDTWLLPECNGYVYNKLLLGPGPVFPSFLVAKEHLESIDLLDESVSSYQEWDTAIRLAKDGWFVHMQEPTFVYCFHDEPTISKDKARDIDGYLYILHKHKKEILSTNPKSYNNQIRNLIYRSIDFILPEKARDLTNEFTIRRLRLLYRPYISFIFLLPLQHRSFFMKSLQKIYTILINLVLRIKRSLR